MALLPHRGAGRQVCAHFHVRVSTRTAVLTRLRGRQTMRTCCSRMRRVTLPHPTANGKLPRLPAMAIRGVLLQRTSSEDSDQPMKIVDIPFGTTDWSRLEATAHHGESGVAYWRTCRFGEIRVRMIEYSAGYVSDHWCVKGHVLFCVAGELHTQLADGRQFTLTPGMSYQVADNAEAHRSRTPVGAVLFVVD